MPGHLSAHLAALVSFLEANRIAQSCQRPCVFSFLDLWLSGSSDFGEASELDESNKTTSFATSHTIRLSPHKQSD